jgi:hypothetical protein
MDGRPCSKTVYEGQQYGIKIAQADSYLGDYQYPGRTYYAEHEKG